MLNATVTRKRDTSPGLFLITVLPDDGVPDFLPGQYIALGLPPCSDSSPSRSRKPKLVKRAYSIGSSPRDRDGLEFYIATVEDGELTPHLANLNVGEKLFAAPKIVGTFTCESIQPQKRLIFVSTGTGIAPYISMLREGTVLRDAAEIYLLHGVRHASDLAYYEELMNLQERDSKFRYLPTVSRDDPKWDGARGYVQEFFRNGSIQSDPSGDHIFLCGNPAMIDELEGEFLQQGFVTHARKNPGNLHLEKYW